jgi:DNA-binding PadR family transcriptional regulator
MSTLKVLQREDEKTTPCPCLGGTLDKLLQPAILAVMAKGPVHGYRLAECLAAMPSFGGQKPDMSGIYRMLKSMEGRLLVVSTWDASHDGPAKRTYQITPEGLDCLRIWVQTLEEYRGRITMLLKMTREAVKTGESNC